MFISDELNIQHTDNKRQEADANKDQRGRKKIPQGFKIQYRIPLLPAFIWYRKYTKERRMNLNSCGNVNFSHIHVNFIYSPVGCHPGNIFRIYC